ncbi:M24 family metallopeptidase [Alphaproteobacteria bacterium GH1-50]|uniref:M24 family metallopeptidase n=1 Tax=Kangsaoukella pontilimi TaxID=2691042 RepID=A0A7C9MDQ1_9RHOB|nr:aminopeptidase P family protein [Kangsaoukella pontilimi]MXQ06636.1 M24 family metallopeptidase [Kangsaoukella pontilimi]
MFQSFTATTSPDQGPRRLARLREAMAEAGVDAFMVPRADAHQGEYVAPCDERLAWLTGFTGSAGFAIVTGDTAGVFVDGRYRVQVRAQVADVFTPVDWPETKPGPWLLEHLADGAVLGIDPWLHTRDEIDRLEQALKGRITIRPVENLVDRIWPDRPAPPVGKVRSLTTEQTGEGSVSKRERLAKVLKDAGERAAVLTLPDSISWLLNIRGSDIPRNPVVQAFAILHDSARVSLFLDPEKVAPLGPDPSIDVAPTSDFEPALRALNGPVRVDRSSAPLAVSHALNEAGIDIAWDQDPCILPKAQKTEAEIAGTREAHLRDAAAMIEFLAWLDTEAPQGGVTEIDAAKALEGFRRQTNALLDISFDTISGAGPNGAIVHYRVTEGTNRPLKPGELYLVDSGGQYLDGTTDITRTVAIGPVPDAARDPFTRVLQGMIAISTARFPKGVAGQHLDALARAPLWRAGLDYDHGTGHGVGVYLNVHEGPQRLSRISDVALEPGMILSNEPGYYREGAFGIRLENLIVVKKAEPLGDKRDHLDFETLTWVPIDTRLVIPDMLAPWERDWLNAYHAEVVERVAPRLSDSARNWLLAAARPI